MNDDTLQTNDKSNLKRNLLVAFIVLTLPVFPLTLGLIVGYFGFRLTMKFCFHFLSPQQKYRMSAFDKLKYQIGSAIVGFVLPVIAGAVGTLYMLAMFQTQIGG